MKRVQSGLRRGFGGGLIISSDTVSAGATELTGQGTQERPCDGNGPL